MLCDDNVIAVNLEDLVDGDWLGDCNTIESYLLIIYVY